MRNIDEFHVAKAAGLFDLIIYIDASERLPKEDESSMSIPLEVADIVITNNSTEAEFLVKIDRLFKAIKL